MYEQFFGLTSEPFAMVPDPRVLFRSGRHQDALAGLNYGLSRRKGIVMLTGKAGTGKTTIIKKIIAYFPATCAEFSLIVTPTVSPVDFLELVLRDFGIEDIPSSKAKMLSTLYQYLQNLERTRRIAVLIVDEAHKLSTELLEEIRLLTNFETANGKLLQTVLSGQPELAALVNREDMQQFKQRIWQRLALTPLTEAEVEKYIEYRWRWAGSEAKHPFTAPAVELIARYSEGLPRVINAICDNALLLTFAEEKRTIGPENIQTVATELDLRLREETNVLKVRDMVTTSQERLVFPIQKSLRPAVQRGGFLFWGFFNNL
jgi:general secretion pathway protein A